MVDPKVIQKQLKKIKFSGTLWNQPELKELPHIIHEGEKISECVNGFYEGGVALLVATEMRLLLIDKKPLNFLTVEDLRFDMINEIDYSHRLFGASITISTGSKTLKFSSYNQPRLRSLIGLVQEHMSNGKKDQAQKAENQQQHLEEINKQLQMYLLAQHQQLQQQTATLPKPDPQLSDYLFAQRLLEQFQRENGGVIPEPTSAASTQSVASTPESAAHVVQAEQPTPPPTRDEILADAKREVFGRPPAPVPQSVSASNVPFKGLEVSPLRIAYSKLPMMLRNRKFGRPSLHAHTQQQAMPTGQPAALL